MSSAESPDFTKNPYIIQSILLLLGPTLFAASIYMILGRLVVLLEADSYSMIRARWLTKVFVLGDLLSFFAQGGGMLARPISSMQKANSIHRRRNIDAGQICRRRQEGREYHHRWALHPDHLLWILHDRRSGLSSSHIESSDASGPDARLPLETTHLRPVSFERLDHGAISVPCGGVCHGVRRFAHV